jgi:hypothetical protein
LFDDLRAAGFEITIKNHAGAIFSIDFAAEAAELEAALIQMRIPVEELVASGGGEARSTQWLRKRLYESDWQKHNFHFEQRIDGVAQVSITHEIDHIRRSAGGVIALEIEWNNKDPFFDRDLENFHRLHAQSAISMGAIITRGASMQAEMGGLVERCLIKHGVVDEGGLKVFEMKDRTARQREIVTKLMEAGLDYPTAFAKQFVADKFGTATTHWGKLEERVQRGVGNPCPLLLIGLPLSIIVE